MSPPLPLTKIQLKQTKTNKRALFTKPQTGSPPALGFQTSSALPSKVYLSSSPESVPTGLWHKNSQHLTQSELVPSKGRWGGRLAGLSTACLLAEHKPTDGRDPLMRPSSSFPFPIFLLSRRWGRTNANLGSIRVLTSPTLAISLGLIEVFLLTHHHAAVRGQGLGNIGHLHSFLPSVATVVPERSIYRSAAHGGKP